MARKGRVSICLLFGESVGTKMAQCKCNCFLTLCPLLLLLTLPCIFSDAFDHLRFNFPAKKLINDLNLFPSQDVNIVHHSNSHANNIVEKPLRFPNLLPSESGVSLDDLAHRAGYYPIQHSHAAKSASFLFNLI